MHFWGGLPLAGHLLLLHLSCGVILCLQVDKALVNVGSMFLETVTGRVSTEVDPRIAFDSGGCTVRWQMGREGRPGALMATHPVRPDMIYWQCLPGTLAGLVTAVWATACAAPTKPCPLLLWPCRQAAGTWATAGGHV
jgi:hypothetical protein